MDNDNAKELISENNKYYIAVDKKEASGDMKHVLNEMVGFGYEKIAEHEYNGDVIVIYAKKKITYVGKRTLAIPAAQVLK